MTTYSKETALYDTGAIATDITDAGTKATNYIEPTEDGIKVHDVSDIDNYALVDFKGLTVYQSGNNAAHFGATARMGSIDGARTEVSSDGVRSYTPDGVLAFGVASGNGSEQQEITKTVDEEASGFDLTTKLSALANGNPFTLHFGSATATVSFTKGTSENKTITIGGKSVVVEYDPPAYISTSRKAELSYVTFSLLVSPAEVTIRNKIVSNGEFYIETRKVLWEEDTPTSAWYAGDTIYFDDEGFDEYEIYYMLSTTLQFSHCAKVPVGQTAQLTATSSANYNRIGSRTAFTDEYSIGFNDAHFNASTNNNYIIPYKVVGIKHV